MEVKGVSQGGQTYLDLNYGPTENTQNINSTSNVTNISNVSSNDDYKNIESKDTSEKKSISDKEIKKAVEKLNKLFEDSPTHVEYEIYGKHRDLTIKIIDDNTKQVIKEVPPKKIIDMVNKLCELAGVFVDDKA